MRVSCMGDWACLFWCIVVHLFWSLLPLFSLQIVLAIFDCTFALLKKKKWNHDNRNRGNIICHRLFGNDDVDTQTLW